MQSRKRQISIKIDNQKNNNINSIKKYFPEQFKSTGICKEHNDILGLETETISTNNFYEQKLRVKDKQPVYIKNYRIPQSHKEEMDKQVKKLIDD